MKNILFILFALVAMQGYAQTAQDVCPLKVGESLPEGIVMDDTGAERSIQSLAEDKPTIFVVYRGAWCGYCTKHLRELNDIQNDVEALGYNMFGLTIDQPEKLEETYAKAEKEIKVFSDSDLDVISALGLNWTVEDETFDKYKSSYGLDLEAWSGQTHHNLPVPAIFIVKEGKVVFQYVNPDYSTRLNPETLLAVLPTL